MFSDRFVADSIVCDIISCDMCLAYLPNEGVSKKPITLFPSLPNVWRPLLIPAVEYMPSWNFSTRLVIP